MPVGTGGIGHPVQTELVQTLFGHLSSRISCTGRGTGVNDTVVAGQVPIIRYNLPRRCPFHRAKGVWCPWWSLPAALAQLLSVPTFKAGLEPVNRMAYYGIYGPKGLPKGRWWDKVNAGVKKALEDPAVRKRIEDTGSIILPTRLSSSPSRSATNTASKAYVDLQKTRFLIDPGLTFIDALWLEKDGASYLEPPARSGAAGSLVAQEQESAGGPGL